MKNKVLTVGFLIIVYGFMIISLLLPDKEISFSERRNLADLPKLSRDSLINGVFFEELNDYLVDNFPLRDSYRNLKGLVSEKIFNKKENNGVFIKDDIIYQSDIILNNLSLSHFTELLIKIENQYLNNDNVYYSIIPDKNYYLNDKEIPKLDYKKLFTTVHNSLPTNFTYIDIIDKLKKDSYYATDIHWKQEELKDVVTELSNGLMIEEPSFPTQKKEYYPFYGALYGRIATNIKPDKLTYLTNEVISNAQVYNYEKSKTQTVYEEANLQNIDSYDIYLSGATPLLILANNENTSGKELILFRDSFGSSIAPLMIESYSKITMIDLRYLNSNLLNSIEEIEFSSPNQDILFLYSIPVINNSFTLK